MIINNLAGGEVEITDIKRFLGGTEYDISDVYFGDKHIFESWRELESPLPITILAAGKDLIDYRIYGNTVQNGTPTPESPIMPEGVGEKTENLFEVKYDMLEASSWEYNPPAGSTVYFINYKLSDSQVQILKQRTCTCSVFENFSEGYIPELLVCAICPTPTQLVDNAYRILGNNGTKFTRTFDFSTWDNIYLVIGYGNGFSSDSVKQTKIDELFTNWLISIVPGSTAPTSYTPYGYKLPMTVSDGNTVQTIPVYIGKSQLVESEYVSYSEGKIYRKNPANYFDGYFELGTIDFQTGEEIPSNTSIRTDFIELEPSNRYYFKWKTGFFYILPVSYDENKDFVRYLGAKSTNPSYFNLGANEKYIRFYLYNTTTPPKEMMVCKNANAPYYDPQDPPVPLPQIPTIKGETVIDYDGTPKPSQMYIKYKS